MLKRSFPRRSVTLGARFLTGVVAVVLSCNFAFSQFSSPATFGVYNRAASMGPGGMGTAQNAQGINAYGAASPSMSAGGGYGSSAQPAFSPEAWETIVVDSPEFVYKGHDPREPIHSVKSFMFNDGQDYRYGVLSGSGDMTAKLWVLEGKYDQETTEWFITGARVRGTFQNEHKQGVTQAIFSPDYAYVLTSSFDQSGRLWTIRKQENIRAYLGARDRLWAIKPSPDGQYVAGACNDGRVYFWEALTVRKLQFLPNSQDSQDIVGGASSEGHDGPIFDVAFDPNSSFVATAGADGTVRIWNLGLMKQVAVLQGHADKVYSVCFSADGSLLLTASRDKTARLWNPNTGEEICRFVGHTGAVRQAVFAGQYICTSSDDGTVRIWTSYDPTQGNQRQGNRNSGIGFGSSSDMITSSPSGLGSSGTRPQQKTAKPTRPPGRPKGVELARFEAGSPVFSVDVSEDLVYIVGGCQDGMARVWRVPGNARYYGDSSSSNYQQGNYGLGSDPLAEPGSYGSGSGSGSSPY
ncbi:MAG: WD40 repeat domain-containing protein [Thermoguttaceae bacterium]|jgi:WD40 repeat protein